jgi:hypothetical protein
MQPQRPHLLSSGSLHRAGKGQNTTPQPTALTPFNPTVAENRVPGRPVLTLQMKPPPWLGTVVAQDLKKGMLHPQGSQPTSTK